MNAKTLTIAALATLIVVVATFSFRLGPAPERSPGTPGANRRTIGVLQEPVDVASRETAVDEWAPGPAPDSSAGPSRENAEDEPLDDWGTGLTGKVVDALGAPVGGAEVWVHSIFPNTPISWFWARRARLATHCDADGAFAVNADPTESLEARASDHAPSRVGPAAADGAPIVLTLRGPAAGIAGAVRAGGSPIAGAKLDLRRPRALVSNGEHASRSFHAGEDGTFALDDLAPGRVALIASAPGFAPRGAQLELRAGETSDVLLELDPGATLTGIVVDPDQMPLVGVEVFAPEHEPPAIARTDERGAFSWTGLAIGPLRVVARYPGFLDADHLQTLSAGENTRCTIMLESLARLEGRVVDASGASVAGVTVEAHAVGSDPGRLAAARDVSDVDGRFQIEVPRGSERAFVLHEPGQWLATDASWLGIFVAPRAGIVLTLRPEDSASAFVIGRVVDEGGSLAGAWFQIDDGGRLGTVGNDTPGTPVSGDAGRFRIGPLPAREFVLVVHPLDLALPSFRSAPFSLAPNEVRDLGDLVVPARATLVGRAFFEDGASAAEAILELVAADGEVLILKFGDDGQLERGLLPGSYAATVYGGGFINVHRKLDLAAGEVEFFELVLRRAVRCPVDVTLPEGETAGRLLLSAADGTEEFETDLDIKDDSRVRWPALTTGEHLAKLTCESGQCYAARFDVAPPDGSDEAVALAWRRIE